LHSEESRASGHPLRWSVRSKLRLRPTSDDDGQQYSCRALHPALSSSPTTLVRLPHISRPSAALTALGHRRLYHGLPSAKTLCGLLLRGDWERGLRTFVWPALGVSANHQSTRHTPSTPIPPSPPDTPHLPHLLLHQAYLLLHLPNLLLHLPYLLLHLPYLLLTLPYPLLYLPYLLLHHADPHIPYLLLHQASLCILLLQADPLLSSTSYSTKHHTLHYRTPLITSFTTHIFPHPSTILTPHHTTPLDNFHNITSPLPSTPYHTTPHPSPRQSSHHTSHG
ncbi:hypothetical protein Pmani_021871, partial [Petrolisthes manimaculis]